VEATTGVMEPGAVRLLHLRFRPLERGTFEARVILRIQGARGRIEEQVLELVGEVIEAPLVLDPGAIDFGAALTGTRISRQIRLQNTGRSFLSLHVEGATNVEPCDSTIRTLSAFCFQDPTSASLAKDQRWELAPGEIRAIEVQFDAGPAGQSERGGFGLRFCEGGRACVVEVALAGRTVERAFECTPAPLDFEPVLPGSCVQTGLECAAIANQVVDLDGVVVMEGEGFSIASEPVAAVLLPPRDGQPGGRVTIPVRHCPRRLGRETGSLLVRSQGASGSAASTQTVGLRGRGGGPALGLDALRVDFGLASIFAPVRRQLEVTNRGVDDLRVRLAVERTTAFSFRGDDLRLIAPGASEFIELDFLPTKDGILDGRLRLETNDPLEPRIEIPLQGRGMNLRPCQTDVVSELDFGPVPLHRTALRHLRIQNLSASTRCLVNRVELTPGIGESGWRLLGGAPTEVFIEPGEALVLPIELNRSRLGPTQAEIELLVSDDRVPVRTVVLRAEVLESSLLIQPRDIVFPPVPPGQVTQERRMLIRNDGVEAVDVQNVEVTVGPFRAHPVPALPQRLAQSGRELELRLIFEPTGARLAPYTGRVEIEVRKADGSKETWVVALEGRSSLEPSHTDVFRQGAEEVDVLFVWDDSGSPGNERLALIEAFDAFVAPADRWGVDYRIAATATERGNSAGPMNPLGRPRPTFVSPASRPSPAEAFRLISSVGGRGGSEVIFLAAFNAFFPPLIAGRNIEFLRPEARLVVIAHTDEPEQSPYSVGFYLDFLRGLKSARDPQGLVVSALSGGNQGCRGTSPAPRLVEMAQRSGGVHIDFCREDFEAVMSELGEATFGERLRFPLTQRPDARTLRVEVDGLVVPREAPSGQRNWRLDNGAEPILVFEPLSAPPFGARIEISFKPAEAAAGSK